jgi:hypothetical protein
MCACGRGGSGAAEAAIGAQCARPAAHLVQPHARLLQRGGDQAGAAAGSGWPRDAQRRLRAQLRRAAAAQRVRRAQRRRAQRCQRLHGGVCGKPGRSGSPAALRRREQRRARGEKACLRR